MTYCIKCKRELTATQSVNRGMGPVCSAQAEIDAARLEELRGDKYDMAFDNTSKDIRCRREIKGENNAVLHFNIYPLVTHHSPDGWEWGYNGSGTSDFALNIIEFFVRQTDRPRVKIRDFTVASKPKSVKICALTQRIYHDFKDKFVAPLAKEGGTIKGSDILAFIEEKREDLPAYLRNLK